MRLPRLQDAREVLRNLYSAKQRSLLALIGIVIGTGSVIAMINIGSIVKEEALRQFLAMGTDLVAIRIETGSGGDRGGPPPVGQREAEEFARQASALTIVAPAMVGGGQVAFAGRTMGGSVVGGDDRLASVANLRMAEGRFISSFDGYAPFVVVGPQFVSRMAASADGQRMQVGDDLRIGEYIFTLIGILQESPYNPLVPFDASSSVFLSMENARRTSGRGEVSTVLGRRGDGVSFAQVQEEVSGFFQPRLRSGHAEVRSAEQLIQTMNSQMQLYTLLLGAIGSISLIVGGVGVMNVMLVSVSERKREIGIRMAVGARRSDIRSMFFLEALVLCLLGGAVGTAVGIGASAVFADISGWQFFLAPGAIPLGAGVSAAVGLFFGFYPAVQASRLDPIEALRAE